MEITQLLDPFNCKVSTTKGGFWPLIILIVVICLIGYYLLRKNNFEGLNFKPDWL
jgi:hypothetical protein